MDLELEIYGRGPIGGGDCDRHQVSALSSFWNRRLGSLIAILVSIHNVSAEISSLLLFKASDLHEHSLRGLATEITQGDTLKSTVFPFGIPFSLPNHRIHHPIQGDS